MTYDPTQKNHRHTDTEPFDDPVRKVGHDATSAFDDSESDPTGHASSEALDAATAVKGEEEVGSDEGDDSDERGDPNVIDAADTGADDADVNVPEFDEEERDEEERVADERDLEGR